SLLLLRPAGQHGDNKSHNRNDHRDSLPSSIPLFDLQPFSFQSNLVALGFDGGSLDSELLDVDAIARCRLVHLDVLDGWLVFICFGLAVPSLAPSDLALSAIVATDPTSGTTPSSTCTHPRAVPRDGDVVAHSRRMTWPFNQTYARQTSP